ncbi:PREDICTED: uncharacterized protein LOC18601589 [Theobroma cacao]|uniref:Uncharacterized protein LOC18601589 n=1 Tax=Theobroma cacao TaxID=3641 RepID=A0AB32V9V2_THECC|nr:PREDICTED: uncharacterized protein LOC18601589 [Theobroma cacao]XP_017975317.1 PREDICTED: uncharacterized protein LOC18601589 [Theobroma cacao]
MGTEVHSNMQLPGYYSLRNLNGNTGNVGWPLHHENRNSGQFNDLFLTRLAMGYDKEQMRQTILKHDSIFRHQLRELHRLYRIQRDMMNEINSEEGNQHLIPVATSQPNPFSSGFMSEDEQKRCHASESHLSDLNCFRLSMSGAHNIQSQFSPLKGNVVQSGCGLTQNGLKLKNCESLESHCSKVQSRLFDLECPAEECINEEEGGQGISAVSGVEIDHLKRSYEVPCKRDGDLSMHFDSNYSCNDAAISFNLNLKETRGFTDLNEPILVEEASTSACVGIPGNITCSKQEVQRKDLSSLSRSHTGFQHWGAEFSHDRNKAGDRGISLNNLHLEAERRQNGWFSSKFENGQTRSNGSFHSEDLHIPCRSVQVETTKAHSAMFLLSDQNKRETCTKRKIFGVDIPEKSTGASAAASHALDPLPVHSQLEADNSEILSCSTWTKFSGNLNQNLLGNPGSRTYGQLNSSSTALMQGHDIIWGKLLVDGNSRSLPSLRAEASSQNDFHFGSPSDSKESRVCCAPVGFCNQNGTSESNFASEQSAQHGPKIGFEFLPCMMESKSAVDLNMGAIAVDNYQNEEISQSGFVSMNRSVKQNSNGGLSWLTAARPCDAKPIKEEVSGQMNLNSLQNCSQQSIEKTAMRIQDSFSATCAADAKHRKSGNGCSSSSTKILGFSISGNVSRDLPLPNSPLKPGFPASAIDGVNSVITHGPLPPKCEQQCLLEGLVAEKRSVNQNADVRHIDLNLCVMEEGVEEDVQSTPSSMRTNIRTAKIDLDMPVAIEMGNNDTSGCEYLESNLTKPFNLQDEEIRESQGLLSVSAAAEALVAISSSCVTNLQENVSCQQSETSASDSLHWFAEIVSSCWSDPEHDIEAANGACLGDSIPDGIDVFEFMTLNLAETKTEEYYYTPQVLENEKSEEPLSKRPRRGQARRGRQRKDFQRDVLPNLTSLSRNEVTEDFQMIEGLIREIGGSWQSSLTQKNNAKGSTGRGRKRSGGSAPPTTTEDCLNQFQQMKTGLEERSLTGWGKRTRRPPRQRYPICSPLAIK